MSKSISNLSANINVGIDEVVTVFVSQYEEKLFDKRKELNSELTDVKKQLQSLEEEVANTVDIKQYVTEGTVIGVKTEVTDVNIVWDRNSKKREPEIVVCVEVKSTFKTDYNNNFSHNFKFPIDQKYVKINDGLEEDKERISSELVEINNQIKSIGRKERQVRAKVASMKLEESGYTDLLSNSDLVGLIKLD